MQKSERGKREKMKIISIVSAVILLFGLMGCSAIGKIENKPVSELPEKNQRYTAANHNRVHPIDDSLIVLAFSGGGTRAAALSYGVLEELRDTQFKKKGRTIRLLDEVDRISSVSGGSFTSAYYGLFGEQIFKDFKQVFLYKDVQGDLVNLVFNLFGLVNLSFSPISRTEYVIDYYDKHIFKGKTFADIQKNKGPFILINASDINSHSQFIFIQQQFDFLCSDLSKFKVARAVAASSAVPVLFPPVLIKKHDDCKFQKPQWLYEAENRAKQEGDRRLHDVVSHFNYYLDKDNPPYVTLLDGGITDNLGLRNFINHGKIAGDIKNLYRSNYKGQNLPRHLVVIVVNASTTSKTKIGMSQKLPSIGDVLSAVTDMQLHLYNTESNELLKESMLQWAEQLSTPEHRIKPYFIELNATDISDTRKRRFFNSVPTSFSIEKQQADQLIELAKELLRDHPEYQRLLLELNANLVN